MAPRSYTMTRRHESAEETRRRIVEATFALHSEKGVAATSIRDIALRADVGLGTVYHHFPTYDDVIRACGAHSAERIPLPDPAIFDRLRGTGARIAALAAAMAAYSQRFPQYERIRAERAAFPPLDAFIRQDEENRRRLIALAAAPRRLSREKAAAAFALLDIAFYRALRDGGLSHAAAAREIELLLRRCLAGGTNTNPRKTRRSPA